MMIATNCKQSTTQPTLTFGYCETCAEPQSSPREECCLIKSTAEQLGITVLEESVEGGYFGTIRCAAALMLQLVKELAALDVAKQTSLEIPREKDSKKFSEVAGLGEVIFTHKGQTYIATGQPKGFKPRISRAA